MSQLHDWRRNAALSFVAPALALWAEKQYREMPRLALHAGDPLPSLSIIIPARNEAHNLLRLLPALQRICYPGPVEIIVVDDGSTDLTAQIAQSYGARVLRVHRLPAGWLGKPHACHIGAEAANGHWLLFIDADTAHDPAGPARAVSHAQRQGLDGLTVFLHQQCTGLLDQLALAAAHAGLFTTIHWSDKLLNGQFTLLRRDVYLQSGGFAAVRGQALEDVALGHHLVHQGYTIAAFQGDDMGSVRMYDDDSALWRGLTRLGSETMRWTGLRSLPSFVMVTALMSPLVTMLGVLLGGLDRRWLPATWLAASVSMIPWAARFGNPWLALLTPLGALFVQAAAVWGFLSRLLGVGISWKGRSV